MTGTGSHPHVQHNFRNFLLPTSIFEKNIDVWNVGRNHIRINFLRGRKNIICATEKQQLIFRSLVSCMDAILNTVNLEPTNLTVTSLFQKRSIVCTQRLATRVTQVCGKRMFALEGYLLKSSTAYTFLSQNEIQLEWCTLPISMCYASLVE